MTFVRAKKLMCHPCTNFKCTRALVQSKYPHTIHASQETAVSNYVHKTINCASQWQQQQQHLFTPKKKDTFAIFCFLFSHYLHDHSYSNKKDSYLQLTNCDILILPNKCYGRITTFIRAKQLTSDALVQASHPLNDKAPLFEVLEF